MYVIIIGITGIPQIILIIICRDIILYLLHRSRYHWYIIYICYIVVVIIGAMINFIIC